MAKIGYSKRQHILEVEFVNGAVYGYLDVPGGVSRDLIIRGIKGAPGSLTAKGAGIHELN